MQASNGPIVVCARHWVRADPPDGTTGILAANPAVYQLFSGKGHTRGVPPVDVPAAARGSLQALDDRIREWDTLAKFIGASRRATVVFASPFLRTLQTADIIRLRWAESPGQVIAAPTIQEVGCKACKLFHGKKDKSREPFSWVDGDRTVTVEYETEEDAAVRFKKSWDDYCLLATRQDVNVVLVTHGDMLAQVILDVTGKEVFHLPELSFVAYAPKTKAVTWSDGIDEGHLDAVKTLDLSVWHPAAAAEPMAVGGPGYVRLEAGPDDVTHNQTYRCPCVLL